MNQEHFFLESFHEVTDTIEITVNSQILSILDVENYILQICIKYT